VVLAALGEQGVDVEALARRMGAPTASAPLTEPQIDLLLLAALEQVGDTGLGLTLGTQVRPELFGVVGFAAMSSATYGEALARMARYKHMVTGDRLVLLRSEEVARVRALMAASDPRLRRLRVDGELSFLIAFGRKLTGRHLRPRRVALRGPAPAHAERYGAFFECPVEFDQPFDEMTLEAGDLELPQVSSDPGLFSLFEQKAEQQLAAAEGSEGTAVRVREALRELLRGSAPDIAVVARRLATSERSLQRHLEEEGTCFQQLLEEVRCELARQYLTTTDMELGELSFLLGFSHPNSLHRAFKRWTGKTPLEYRHAARQAPARAGDHRR
jgi:AraC-like DNA-binding protein